MGTTAQKKKFDGMSQKNAKAKLTEIFAKECTHSTLNRVNKDFAAKYGISFFAMAEIWHRLRSQNKSVELMIQAFAEAISKRNAHNDKLAAVIHNQRKALEELQFHNKAYGITAAHEKHMRELAQGKTPD